MYSQNGVPFVYASEGETYAGIAETCGLFLREILKYNDLDAVSVLTPGDVVYIQPKKKQAAYGLDKYIAENDGEVLWDIAQRFAVKLESLCKMNHVSAEYVLREGEVLKLRK
jgi:LysM repeat protein